MKQIQLLQFGLRASLVGIIFFSICAHAETIDSLKAELDKCKVDTLRSDIYYQLSVQLHDDETSQALEYTRMAEQLALKHHDVFRQARALQERGVCYDISNEMDSCLYFLRKADSMYERVQRYDKKATALCDMGIAYQMRGNYELSLRNFLAALTLMEKYSSPKEISKVMNNIGLIYRSRKEYDNALRYYSSSLKMKKELNDEKGILNTTMNIGSVYQSLGKFDSAYFYATSAQSLATKLNLNKDVLNSQSNMGAALASLKRNAEAIEILLKTEQQANEFSLYHSLPTVFESLGSIYLSQGNIQLGISYFKKGLALSQGKNSLEEMAIFHKQLARGYATNHEFQNAYLHLDTSKRYYDSMMNIENSRQINEMTAVYESNQKEKQIQTLHAENKINEGLLDARKKERNYFILSTILFVVLSGLAFAAYRESKRKKALLDLQKQQIEKSLKEKEVLLKEIHHRVKNNLQIVSSLLSLQSNYIEDEKALDAVRESKNRVQSMAIIHQNLYQDESLVNIDVKEYVEKLVEYLFHSYSIHGNAITLEKDIQPLRLDVDTLVPLGLVLNELINNCLKYAFPNQRKGKIRVIMKQEDQTLRLSVYDNGVGMKGSDSHFNQNSFGHKMIHAFMKKLKAELSIYDEDGTRVDILIPNFKPIIE